MTRLHSLAPLQHGAERLGL